MKILANDGISKTGIKELESEGFQVLQLLWHKNS